MTFGISDDPATEVSGGSLDRLLAVDEPSNTSVITRCCDDQLNPPCDPRSVCKMQPATSPRRATALLSAVVAKRDFIRASMQ